MSEFEGKVVVITGAGGGLGRSHALEFARRGAKVVVNDLGGAGDGTGSGDAADAVVEEIKAEGGVAIANKASVSSREGAKSIIDDAVAEFGTIDILVNNAGILRDKSFKKMPLDDWDIVMDVHMNGTAYATHAAWPIMYEKNWGRIVLTSSTSGIFGNFGQANYGAAKAGIAGFSRVLALELAKYGCTVNTISPGALTRMTIPLREARGEEVKDEEISEGGPQHIAPICVWLATEAAAGITSQIFHTARGGVGIMQQPRVIKQYQKSGGLWTLDELDRVVPDLVAAREANEAAAKESGKPIEV